MKVLIGCERFGVIRDAFLARGHDAYSCDLVESETPGPHIVCDVRDAMHFGWDLFICHPDCTFLTVANTYMTRGCSKYTAEQAKVFRREAIDFFMCVANAPVDKVGVENPVGVMSTLWRKPDQIIQPWQFGDDASKKTCLWLKNLPPLTPTKIVDPKYACRCGARFDLSLGKYGCPFCCGDKGAAKAVHANQTYSGQNSLGPSPQRAMLRAKTYPGIAQAMAEQWGCLT